MKTCARRALLIGPMLSSSKELVKALKQVKCGRGDVLIAVDEGLRKCLDAELTPDIAVGDWDSLSNRKLLAKVPHLTLPCDKDRSDLYYALEVALSLEPEAVICIGFSGGRPDHHLGMLLDLARLAAASDDFDFTTRLKTVCAIAPDAEYYFLSKRIPRWQGKLKEGQLLSVFALGGEASGVTLRGLEYPLRNAPLSPSSRALSNEVSGAHGGLCSVQLSSGQLVVVIPTPGAQR